MTINKKIMERIEKLLRMAEDVASPNEAAIAAKRAKSLMEQYQIDHSDIIIDDIRNDGVIKEDFEVGSGRMPQYLDALAVAVGRLYDCEIRRGKTRKTWDGKGGKVYHSFYGYKDDVKIVGYTFDYLQSAISSLTERDWKVYKSNGGSEHGRSWKESYRKGAASAICQTLREMKQEQDKKRAEDMGVGTGLMVVKQEAITEKFGNFSYSTVRRKVSSSSYDRGYQEGKKVRINSGLNNDARQAIR